MRRRGNIASITIGIVSILLAIALAVSGAVHDVLRGAWELDLLASLLGGMLFSSAFTTPIAIVILAEAAQEVSPVVVAFLGGLGAVFGDMVMFVLIRDGARRGIMSAYRHAGGTVPKARWLRRYGWLANVVGFLIIASPFPDEIGVALLGMTNAPMSRFITISFTANFFGILLVGLAGRAVA